MPSLYTGSDVKVRRSFTLIYFVPLMLGLTGCSGIFETVELDKTSSIGCTTSAGAYFLPKRHIRVTVTQAASKFFALTLDPPFPAADRDSMFCLDYLGSATAHDTIEIKRSDIGLLQEINATAADKSKDIALKVFDIGLIAVTGNPDATLRKVGLLADNMTTVLARFEFDPFDWQRLTQINAALRDYGYCVYIDAHKPLPRGLDVGAYCENPDRHAALFPTRAPSAAIAASAVKESKTAILYRANFTHHLIVLRKRDPKSKDKWELYHSEQLEMPNFSPIFSVPVDRTVLVTKVTKLMFVDGVLQDVTIDKPSEMLEFSELPLKLVHAVVQVPAEIIRVRITASNNRERLLRAQTQLVLNQRSFNDTIAALSQNTKAQQYNNSAGARDLDINLPAGRATLVNKVKTQCRTALLCEDDDCIDRCVQYASVSCLDDATRHMCIKARFPGN